MRILKYALSFTLLAAMAVTASAQNYFNSRSLANKLKKGTTPECKIVAVDNSESLLHTADSIAALSDNNRPDIMFLPVVVTSYKTIQPMAPATLYPQPERDWEVFTAIFSMVSAER